MLPNLLSKKSDSDQSDQEPDATADSTENDESNIKITRRDAIIAASSVGVLSSVAAGTALGDTQNLEVDLENFDSTNEYLQYYLGNINTFEISSNISVSIEIPEVTDDKIQLRGWLSLDGGTEERFAYELKDIPNNTPTTITFDAPGLWDDNAAEASLGAGDNFDLGWLDNVDSDYANLSAPDTVNNKDDLVESTTVKLRFEALSTNGQVEEKDSIKFNLNVGHRMGMGAEFGTGFGKNHVESWEGKQGNNDNSPDGTWG